MPFLFSGLPLHLQATRPLILDLFCKGRERKEKDMLIRSMLLNNFLSYGEESHVVEMRDLNVIIGKDSDFLP